MSRFNWDSETPFQNENLPPDLLDRAKHASFLTKTINNEVNPNRGGDINSIKSHVLNLNADWGAGKTYFLKRWANSLKQDHPVVYIDVKQDRHIFLQKSQYQLLLLYTVPAKLIFYDSSKKESD